MNKKDEALKMVIYLLDNVVDDPRCSDSIDKIIKVCKEALKQKEWQELTNEEIELLDFRKNYMEIYHDTDDDGCYFDVDTWEHDFARIIEQKIKEKNS